MASIESEMIPNLSFRHGLPQFAKVLLGQFVAWVEFESQKVLLFGSVPLLVHVKDSTKVHVGVGRSRSEICRLFVVLFGQMGLAEVPERKGDP